MEPTLPMLQRLQRAHRCLSRCSRLTIRGLPEADLLKQMCDLAVRDAGYRFAWVGYAEPGPDRIVRAVAKAGFEEGYLGSVEVHWGDGPLAAGPTGTAIRTGVPCVAMNLSTDESYSAWRSHAVARGYASSAAVPLRDGDVVFGAFNLYASEPDAFDPSELALLEEMADDLAFGIRHARGVVRLSGLEEALRRSDRLETVGRVSASIAHDVNNLLFVIAGAAADLRQTVDAPEIDDIDHAIDRAAALNRELLSFARRAPSVPVEIDVDTTVARLLALVSRSLHVETRLFLDAGDARIRMDLSSFERALTNLIANAGDAMPDGGQLTLRSSRRKLAHPLPPEFTDLPPGLYVQITVEDTGVGMSHAVLARMFEPFFTTKGEAGTGLGLSSAYGTVRQAGGGIGVRSVEGQGTTFEIVIPAVFPDVRAG